MEEDAALFGIGSCAVVGGSEMAGGEADGFVADNAHSHLRMGAFFNLCERGEGLSPHSFGIDEPVDFAVGFAFPPFAGFPPFGESFSSSRLHFAML